PREEAPPAPVKQPVKPTEEIVTPAPAPTPPKPLIDAGGKVSRLVCEARELDVDLTAGPITIGREEGDVVLEGDSAASRLHAQITPENEMFYIEDLGSTNGTWVNRHKITRRVELHRGDLVQIGETSFQVL
ncbi:MAG: FHA domain-containing protein, partial [Candidatus Eremiobacteraeota bacterium]|nr:FHA domain-containing protein [Candidatus Eremiobacteraeota bacterium]